MEMVLQQRGSAAGVSTCRPGPLTPPPPRTATLAEQEAAVAGELRRGPWTVDEDLTLINYIAEHGEGRWNALARAAGLKRTGKSCRLRWLNYLRPDVKRGDFTADEQLLILDLHSRWGNRWSKIAAQLPGRTDNEIKNYWRTRVQKHAKQLNCDVNSRRFKDAMTYLWMPRLAERASQATAPAGGNDATSCLSPSTMAAATTNPGLETSYHSPGSGGGSCVVPSSSSSDSSTLTSTESSSPHEERSVVHLLTHHHGGAAGEKVIGGGDCWAVQGAADQEFWSTAAALQQLNVVDEHSHQFQDLQELSGWVQGFSEGVSPADHGLWSLDDIWRMQ